MKRKIMQRNANLTLKEACEKYLDNCVQRNLSEFTVLHYRESYEAVSRDMKRYRDFGYHLPISRPS